MLKFHWLYLLFLAFAGVVFSQDCDNPLLDLYGLTEYSSPTSISSSSIKYCSNIKSSKSTCCSSDTINDFQSRINDLKESLSEKASKRDKYIWQTQHSRLSKLKTAAISFSEAADQALPLLVKINSGSVTRLQQLITIAKTVRDDSADLINSFSTYQQSRTKCIEELVFIHASLWCLACDPDYANQGVDSGPAISFDPSVSTKVVSSCYDYIANGADQSMLLQFRTLFTLFEDLTVVLNLIANGQIYLNLNFALPTTSSDEYTQPNLLPDLCTSSSACTWAFENLLTVEGIDETLLGYGGGPLGTIFGLSSTTRRLQEKKRILIGGTYWNPYQNKPLTDSSFSDNPASLSAFKIHCNYWFISVVFGIIFIFLL